MRPMLVLGLLLVLTVAEPFSNCSPAQELPASDTHTTKMRKSSSKKPNCYNLGYRYGKYGAMGVFGKKGNPNDANLVIPEECRSTPELEKGIKKGVEEVYAKHQR